MSKIYYHLIKTYTKESKKLISERMTKNHLIVVANETTEGTDVQSTKTLNIAKKFMTNLNT